MDEIAIRLGIIAAHSPSGNKDGLCRLAAWISETARPVLEGASRAKWQFEHGETLTLSHDNARRAADFLGEASLRLAEQELDVVIILTDVPLVSRSESVVAGLASPLARVGVISVRRLVSERGAELPLDREDVRLNAAALLLHLIGHVLGLRHRTEPGRVMSPFRVERTRTVLPRFADDSDQLARRAAEFPDPQYRARGRLHDLWLHARLAARHPGAILASLWRNRALLLPLRMPGLATAAVAPTFLLVFTAEFWDAGLGMANATAAAYALVSIIGATLYLAFVQDLFLPRKARHVVTEHLAVVNAVILLTMLLAVIGLFLMVAALTLVIELWIFPPGLIATWPTLQDPEVTLGDKFRLAAFISTIGITTGALAGGLERQNVMRGLALFEREV